MIDCCGDKYDDHGDVVDCVDMHFGTLERRTEMARITQMGSASCVLSW